MVSAKDSAAIAAGRHRCTHSTAPSPSHWAAPGTRDPASTVVPAGAGIPVPRLVKAAVGRPRPGAVACIP